MSQTHEVHPREEVDLYAAWVGLLWAQTPADVVVSFRQIYVQRGAD
jgi:hypothetical protein